MIKENIYAGLRKNISEKKSSIIVGIDPDIRYIPKEFFPSRRSKSNLHPEKVSKIYLDFGKEVIDIASDIAIGIKLQSAFFERWKWYGIKTFFKLAEYAHGKNLFTIADVKRTDIPNTVEQYFYSYLKDSPFDSMTTLPFFGFDALETQIDLSQKYNKALFVVLIPTNEGGEKLQTIETKQGMMFEFVAKKLKDMCKQIGVVCKPEGIFLKRIRSILAESVFLIPGIGAQKGAIEEIKPAFDKKKNGVLVNISRSVIYPEEFGVIRVKRSKKKWAQEVYENLYYFRTITELIRTEKRD